MHKFLLTFLSVKFLYINKVAIISISIIFSSIFPYLDMDVYTAIKNRIIQRVQKKGKENYSQEENIFILRSLQPCSSSSSIPRTKKILHSSKRLYENYLDVTLIIFNWIQPYKLNYDRNPRYASIIDSLRSITYPSIILSTFLS